ncbi:MAG TPA: hypothetical protein VHU91_10720, partial [Mycobacteriales bacterium]|nr:hypothetical protein [Mycobacteriales bacterium]
MAQTVDSSLIWGCWPGGGTYRKFSLDPREPLPDQLASLRSGWNIEALGREFAAAHAIPSYRREPSTAVGTAQDVAARSIAVCASSIPEGPLERRLPYIVKLVDELTDVADPGLPPVEPTHRWRLAQLEIQRPVEQLLLEEISRQPNQDSWRYRNLLQAAEQYYATFRDWALPYVVPSIDHNARAWDRRWLLFNGALRGQPGALARLGADRRPMASEHQYARHSRLTVPDPSAISRARMLLREQDSALSELRSFIHSGQTPHSINDTWTRIRSALGVVLYTINNRLDDSQPDAYNRVQALPIGTVIEALWKAEAGWPMAMAEHRNGVASLTAALERIEAGLLHYTITTAQLRDQLTTANNSLFPIGPSDPTKIDAGRAELQRYIDQTHTALLGSRDLAADTELIDRGLALITGQTRRLGGWDDTASQGNRYRAAVVLDGVRQTCDLVHSLTARSGPIGDTALLATLSDTAALTALGAALDEPNTEPVDTALLAGVHEFGNRIAAVLETQRPAETGTRSESEVGYWLPQLAQSSTLRLSPEAATDDLATAKTAKTRARASGVPTRAFHEAALDAAGRASSPAELHHNLELWIQPAIEFYAADVSRKSHLTEDLLAASEPILRAMPALTPLIGTDAQNYHGLGQRLVRRLEAVEAEIAASPHGKRDTIRTTALLTIRKGLRDQLGRVVTDFADGVCGTTTAFAPILDVKLRNALAKIAPPSGRRPDYSQVDPAHSHAINQRFQRGRANMEIRQAINEGHLQAAVG